MKMNSFQAGLWILLLSLLSTQMAWAKEKRIALVIGNSHYQAAPLANPVNDARLMASNLEKLGFEVILKTDATQIVMDEAIEQFGRRLEDGGVGLFYYAGHGIQSRGHNYLIPVNSRLKREKDLKYKAVDAGAVLDEMGNAANGLNIVILDACRDNPLSRSFRSKSRGLTRIDEVPTGTLLAYSTALGKVAADGDGENSPYTTALVEAMNQPGRPLLMVFQDVLKRVKKETRGKQTPWFNTSVEGDFYFTSAKAQPPVKPPVQSITPATEMADKHEIEFWGDVKATPSKVMYEAYLEEYPDGHYQRIARIKLSEYERSALSQKSNTQHTKSEGLKLDNGALLAMGCFSCHGFNGKSVDSVTPSINEVPNDEFIDKMSQFKKEMAGGLIMTRIAKGYTRHEIQLLADYFSTAK